MLRVRDVWYIRLPNGRELKAKTTEAVIHHIESGVIPRASRVRRSPDEEWTDLEWTIEFTETVTGRSRLRETNGRSGSAPDLGALAGVASRLDPMRLQTVGVRGLWDDLIAALDTTFARGKIMVAGVGAAGAGLLLTPAWQTWLSETFGLTSTWSARAVALATTLLALAVLSWACGLVVRIAYVELSNMRPARWREAAKGYAPLGLRLIIANLLIVGLAMTLMQLLRVLPAETVGPLTSAGMSAGAAEVMGEGLAAGGLVLEIALWFVVGTAWLLTPLLVAEELSIFKALRAWWSLLRANLRRIMLAEALALGLGVLITLPFVLPVWLAAEYYHPPLGLLNVVWGAALAPLAAFLAVANVFIYLDVRYEQKS